MFCLENTTTCPYLCLTLSSHFGNTKQTLFPSLPIKVCTTQVLYIIIIIIIIINIKQSSV